MTHDDGNSDNNNDDPVPEPTFALTLRLTLEQWIWLLDLLEDVDTASDVATPIWREIVNSANHFGHPVDIKKGE